jgi:hypothetical protein
MVETEKEAFSAGGCSSGRVPKGKKSDNRT